MFQDSYRKHYVDIGFERAGLFRAIRNRYQCREALYPGSFVHITPSFYFPHVLYVDQSPVAAKFFADTDRVLDHINRNKIYKQSSHVRFIADDYSKTLPIREGECDLLISLYAGGIARACKQYLRRGGILVTNNHHDDAREAAMDHEYELVAVVQYRSHTYRLDEDNLEGWLAAIGKVAGRKDYLRRTSRGVAYAESDDYFVFSKR